MSARKTAGRRKPATLSSLPIRIKAAELAASVFADMPKDLPPGAALTSLFCIFEDYIDRGVDYVENTYRCMRKWNAQNCAKPVRKRASRKG
jgi:hypothetical protein